MKKYIIIFLIFLTTPSLFGATCADTSPFICYVDPEYTGATRDGTSNNPWQSLSDTLSNTPWTILNNGLSTNAVTVYFSARKADDESDIDNRTQVAISIVRNDNSTHRLTLDGSSKYNRTRGTNAPNWTNYSGNSKFRINSIGVPVIQSDATGTHENYVTIHGFRMISHAGQIANLVGMSNLIFEDNEGYGVTGSNYSIGTNIAITGGTGTGATIDIIQVNDEGSIMKWVGHTPGTGYTFDESIGVTGGDGQAALRVDAQDGSGGILRSILNAQGPGIYNGAAQQGIGHNQGSNVVIQNNTIHNTFGEAIYIGASSSDPPNGNSYSGTGIQNTVSIVGVGTGLTVNILALGGTGGITNFIIGSGGTGYAINDLITVNGSAGLHATYQVSAVSGGVVTQLSNWQTSTDTLIQGNTIYEPGMMGGQADGIDVKDGNENLRVIGNNIDLTGATNSQNRCIIIESAILVEQNFCITKWNSAIVVSPDWNNVYGRTGTVIRNNLFFLDATTVFTNSRSAVEIEPAHNAIYQFFDITFDNNTIIAIGSTLAPSVSWGGPNPDGIGSDNFPTNVIFRNNIFYSDTPFAQTGYFNWTGTNIDENNLFYSVAAGGADFYAGTTITNTHYTTSTYHTFEASARGGNPNFISLASPYSSTNLELGMGSDAIAHGANLSSDFTIDFCNNTRTIPWDIGGWIVSPGMTTGCATGIDNLVFTTQPSNTLTSSSFSPTIVVKAELSGMTDTSFSGNISLTINNCGAALTGTVTQMASSGISTFTGLGVITPGTGCILTATATNASSGTSNLFDVTGSIITTGVPNPQGFFLTQ